MQFTNKKNHNSCWQPFFSLTVSYSEPESQFFDSSGSSYPGIKGRLRLHNPDNLTRICIPKTDPDPRSKTYGYKRIRILTKKIVVETPFNWNFPGTGTQTIIIRIQVIQKKKLPYLVIRFK